MVIEYTGLRRKAFLHYSGAVGRAFFRSVRASVRCGSLFFTPRLSHISIASELSSYCLVHAHAQTCFSLIALHRCRRCHNQGCKSFHQKFAIEEASTPRNAGDLPENLREKFTASLMINISPKMKTSRYVNVHRV